MIKSKKYCMFIVKHSHSYEKRLKALKFIFHLYKHTPSIESANNKEEEIKKIKNELYEFLLDALQNNTDPDIREEILLELHDEKLAAQVVFSDEDCFVRQAAIHILHDNEVLYRVALNDSDYYIKEEAVCNIYDVALLEKLRDDNSGVVSETASIQLEYMKKTGFKTKMDKEIDDIAKEWGLS